MENPTKKMGRPRAYANAVAMLSLKEPTKEVVNQGRRAGQPKSSCLSQRLDSAGGPYPSPLENKRESGGHKKEGSDFGRIQSVPSVPESSGNEWRIRMVNQEYGSIPNNASSAGGGSRW